MIKENGKTRKKRMRKQLSDFATQVAERIEEVRQAKSKLLEELDQEIEKGNSLRDKEEIEKFLTKFENFLSLFNARENHQIQVEKLADKGTKKIETIVV